MTSSKVPLPDWAVTGAEVVCYSRRTFDLPHLLPLRIVRLTATQVVTDSRDPEHRSYVRRWKLNHGAFREFGGSTNSWSGYSELMAADDPRVVAAVLETQRAEKMRLIIRTVEKFTAHQTSVTAQAALEALHRYLSINSTIEPKDSTS